MDQAYCNIQDLPKVGVRLDAMSPDIDLWLILLFRGGKRYVIINLVPWEFHSPA